MQNHPLNTPWQPRLQWPKVSLKRTLLELLGAALILCLFAFIWIIAS